MKQIFRFFTGSLLFRVFAPIVILSCVFTFIGAKLLYNNSLSDLTAINKSSVENEVKRVFYITESKFTTLFLTYGSDQAMYKTLTPSIKQETISELDRFADYSRYCYGLIEDGRVLQDSCGNRDMLMSVAYNKPLRKNGVSTAMIEFIPWNWKIIVYSQSVHFERMISDNIKTIALSIGAFTLATLLFFLLIFYVMVRRPFFQILNHLHKIEKGEHEKLELFSSREMHTLVNGINQLGSTIQARTDELLETNRLLNERVKEETEKNMESARIIYENQRHHALSSMLMNIAHHWRQPLNVVSLMIQDIEEEVKNGTITPEYITSISEQAQRELSNMSKTINRFTKLYENKDTADSINLYEQCLHSVEYIRNLLIFTDAQIEVDVPKDMIIFATEQDILEIFIKLLDNTANAVRATGQTSVRIRISAAALNEGTMIVIEDTAGGIPAEMLNSVFEPYTTTSFKQKQKGLGLYLVKRLLEDKYQGTIRAENTHTGTRITVFIKNII